MKSIRNRRERGYTLTELMIVVAILGILTAITLPRFDTILVKGRRAEGIGYVMQVASAQERYFTQRNTYTTLLSTLGLNDFSGATSAGSAYTVVVAAGASADISTSFAVSATPTRADAICGNLTINEVGQRGITGTGTVTDCWRN